MEIKHKQADIDNLFDVDVPAETKAISSSEQEIKLKEAQDVNRGRPRKGEKRPKLKQINITCLKQSSEELNILSLKTGKTKRSLMEEAISHLTRKYKHIS